MEQGHHVIVSRDLQEELSSIGERSAAEAIESQRSQSTPGLEENVRVGWESERPSDRQEPPVRDTKGMTDDLSASYAAHLTIKATSAEEPTPDEIVQDSEADVLPSPDKAMDAIQSVHDHGRSRQKIGNESSDEGRSQTLQKDDGDPTDINTTMESALVNSLESADPIETEAGQDQVGADEPVFGRFSHTTILWQSLREAIQPFLNRMFEPPLPNGKTRIRWTCVRTGPQTGFVVHAKLMFS